jgi:uncharacterized protein (DUF4213/DUF364 family)
MVEVLHQSCSTKASFVVFEVDNFLSSGYIVPHLLYTLLMGDKRSRFYLLIRPCQNLFPEVLFECLPKGIFAAKNAPVLAYILVGVV